MNEKLKGVSETILNILSAAEEWKLVEKEHLQSPGKVKEVEERLRNLSHQAGEVFVYPLSPHTDPWIPVAS